MDQLGVRQLRIATADAVRRAGAGERIVITVAGRAVAQLGPLEPVGTALTLDDLAARGLVVRARRRDHTPPATTVELWTGSRLDRLLAEVRGS